MATNYFRYDSWTKTAQGPAVPGAQIYVCTQPANVNSAPPSPLASIYSDPNGLVPVTQPLIADGFGHVDFYALAGLYTIVVAIGGIIQQVYPDQSLGGVGTGGAGLILQVNGTPNAVQSELNLTGSGTVTVTDNGNGTVSIAGAGSGGGVLGKWPGNWIGSNASGMNGFSFTAGANMGSALAGYQSNSTGTGSATATEGRFLPDVASTSLSGSGGLADGNFNISLGILEDWFIKLKIRSIASPTRYWIGFSDQTSTNAETVFFSNTPAANFVGFRFSTSAGDSNLQAVCQTGSSTQTIVNTGIAPNTSTPQILEVVPTASGRTITFYINGVLVATISTNVPTNSVAMSTLVAEGDASGNSAFDWFYFYALLVS